MTQNEKLSPVRTARHKTLLKRALLYETLSPLTLHQWHNVRHNYFERNVTWGTVTLELDITLWDIATSYIRCMSVGTTLKCENLFLTLIAFKNFFFDITLHYAWKRRQSICYTKVLLEYHGKQSTTHCSLESQCPSNVWANWEHACNTW